MKSVVYILYLGKQRCIHVLYVYVIIHLEDIFCALSHFTEKEFNINSMFFMFKNIKSEQNKIDREFHLFLFLKI